MSVYISEPIVLRQNFGYDMSITLGYLVRSIRPWQFSSLFKWLFILLFVLEPQNVENLLLLMPKIFLLVPWQFITIATISLGILYINLALKNIVGLLLYHTHPPGQLGKCGNWALVATTALRKVFQLRYGHCSIQIFLMFPDIFVKPEMLLIYLVA